MHNEKTMNLKCLFVFSGIAAGTLLFVTNWLVSAEMDVLRFYTSEYVHTSSGFLTTIGFLITGFFISLFPFVRPKLLVTETAFSAYGLFWILLAFFPADKRGVPTTTGTVHEVLAAICFFLFIALFIAGLIREKEYRHPVLVCLFFLDLSGLILMVVHKEGPVGLYQRIYIFTQIAIMEAILAKRIFNSRLSRQQEKNGQTGEG